MSTRRSFLKHVVALGATYGLMLPRIGYALTFPRLAARNLMREDVALPAGFSGSRNVVFVVFARSQQEDVDTWEKPLAALKASQGSSLQSWQATVMGDIGKTLRAIVEGAMRGIIKSDEARARYLLLYGDKPELLAGFGSPREDEILVLLLDGSGDELWRAAGVWSADAEAGLRAALAAS